MATEPIMETRTYTVSEVAKLLGIGRASAYQAVQRGEIPSLRIGTRLVCPKVAIHDMIANAGRDQATATA